MSRIPRTNSSRNGSLFGVPARMYPTRGVWSVCCARTASGHAAAPPRSVMNLRRLDHLVSGNEQSRWYGQAERLRSLEIDDQLEFYRLLHRQVRWLSAFENPPGIDAREAKRIGKVGSVTH